MEVTEEMFKHPKFYPYAREIIEIYITCLLIDEHVTSKPLSDVNDAYIYQVLEQIHNIHVRITIITEL